MAYLHGHVDGQRVVDAPAHPDGPRAAPQHHRRETYVLRDHHIAGFQTLYDGEIGAVRTHSHGHDVHPETVLGSLGATRVAMMDVTLQVLRGVPRDDRRYMPASCDVERLAGHGAGVGIYVKGRGHLFRFPSPHRPLYDSFPFQPHGMLPDRPPFHFTVTLACYPVLNGESGTCPLSAVTVRSDPYEEASC